MYCSWSNFLVFQSIIKLVFFDTLSNSKNSHDIPSSLFFFSLRFYNIVLMNYRLCHRWIKQKLQIECYVNPSPLTLNRLNLLDFRKKLQTLSTVYNEIINLATCLTRCRFPPRETADPPKNAQSSRRGRAWLKSPYGVRLVSNSSIKGLSRVYSRWPGPALGTCFIKKSCWNHGSVARIPIWNARDNVVNVRIFELPEQRSKYLLQVGLWRCIARVSTAGSKADR